MRTRVVKLCITPDQFIQNILLPEKDEMWRHLLQKNFQNRIVRDPSRLAKCQTRRNNGTKSIQASKEMSSYNFQGTFKCFITLLCFNRNPSNAMNQHKDAPVCGGSSGKWVWYRGWQGVLSSENAPDKIKCGHVIICYNFQLLSFYSNFAFMRAEFSHCKKTLRKYLPFGHLRWGQGMSLLKILA